mmetsp:Transcript_4790/g.5987  ORF Transcript_4790/g.5987 Transcript_4790/m.5987 type:complete len:88 (+) Transcript_4790:3-266(+)
MVAIAFRISLSPLGVESFAAGAVPKIGSTMGASIDNPGFLEGALARKLSMGFMAPPRGWTQGPTPNPAEGESPPQPDIGTIVGGASR